MISINKSLKAIIIDDTEDIHTNIKVLFESKEKKSTLDKLSDEIFGNKPSVVQNTESSEFEIEIDSAYQGKQGFEMIKEAYESGTPYAVAVVDMRMPPGWDGLITIEKIREVDQDIQIIICSAYSDYSWIDIADRLGVSDRYLFLSKPFEVAEMKQMIVSLSQKWTLNRRVQEKIGELKAAKKAIESAARAKEDFLGVMSHELRTPLNIIIMTIEDFLETESNPDNTRILKNSEESAKYLARLIDNIMYFVYLDSHNFQHDNTEVDLNELIHEILNESSGLKRSQNIKVETSIDKNMPTFQLDKKPLSVAISQIIDNAFKFTDEGSIIISATLNTNTKEQELILTVEDTGLGMNSQELGQAFDLFSRHQPDLPPFANQAFP